MALVKFLYLFAIIGFIFYADDMFLFSGSILHLQISLHICFHFGVEFDLTFNAFKSFLIQFGLNRSDSLPFLSLVTRCLQWADRIKYLGAWLEGPAKFS